MLLSFALPPAWGARPAVVFIQSIRAGLREKPAVPNEAIGRLELPFGPKEGSWGLSPFFEARRDVEDGLWSRMEAGVELGVKPFARWKRPLSWFYVGNGIHRAWVKPGHDRLEWEIRTLVDIPVTALLRSWGFKLYALNEYTYDLQEGRESRNEVAAGFKMPLKVSEFPALLGLGWRHVDWVHGDDADQFEGSFRLTF